MLNSIRFYKKNCTDEKFWLGASWNWVCNRYHFLLVVPLFTAMACNYLKKGFSENKYFLKLMLFLSPHLVYISFLASPQWNFWSSPLPLMKWCFEGIFIIGILQDFLNARNLLFSSVIFLYFHKNIQAISGSPTPARDFSLGPLLVKYFCPVV